MEGIPTCSQKLIVKGKELANNAKISDIAKDKDQILLLTNLANNTYRLQTYIKSDHNRYLDEDQVEISIHFESNAPITYKRYKHIWKHIMGFNDKEDYELRLGNKAIIDDDMIIDDSGMRDTIYDLQFHLYLEEDRKVYYY